MWQLPSIPDICHRNLQIRKLGCTAGINITASHNPPEYNGYKVYWEDGAQITPPHDTGIMDEVKKVTDYSTVKTMSLEDARAAGLYETIGAAIDDAYIAELKKLVVHQDAIDAVGKDLKIVYTPLHGTGNIPVRRVLKELGFENVYVVPEQELPDRIYQYGRCHCRILWHSVNRSINRIQVYRWQNLRVRKDRKRNLPLWYGRKLRLPDRNLCKR